jgi:hypothetical protein
VGRCVKISFILKKLFGKKRFLVLYAFVVCMGAILFFRHEMFQFGVEAFLNCKAPGSDWKLDYDRVAIKNGEICFFRVTLKSQQIETVIERADLKLKHRKGLRFDFGLRIKAPYVFIKQDDASPFSILDYADSSFSHVKVDIDEGEAVFVSEKKEERVYFSLTSDEQRRALGEFHFSDKPLTKERPNVVLKLYEWPEEWMVELEFAEANLPWINQVVRASDWSLTKGTVDGRLLLGIAKAGVISQVNATLRFAHVSGADEKNGIYSEIESLLIDTSYPTGKKGGIFWQNSALKLDISGGIIGCKDEKTNIDFAVCDLSGHVNFHSFKDSLILLQGYLDHNDQMTPIVLSANPSSTDKETLDVDLKLSESNLLTHLNLSIAREGEDLCVVRGKLKELDAPQLAMFQHAFGFFSPQFKRFSLGKGTVTTELSLRILKGKIEKVLLDDIIADDIEVYLPEKDIRASCAHLSGRASLDFQNLFSFDMPNWELKVQNGELVYGGSEPIVIQGVSMQLAVCRKVFEPSWIRACYDGIDILLDVVGYYSEADVTMHLVTTGDRILDLISKEKGKYPQFQDHKIHTDIDFHRQLGYWEVSGKTYLNVIDDWEDSAKFGLFLSDQILSSEQWKEMLPGAISKGWFETDLISFEFMKFLSVLTESDWLLEGLGAFKGTFNGESLDAKVVFSRANFFSPLFDMIGMKESEGQLTCNFREMSGRGVIPLHEVVIHDKQLGLAFSDTQGELIFERNSVRLNKFVTEAEGVIFGGNLEFSHPLIKLEIDSLAGSVRQLENLIHHVPKWKDLHLPLEGLIRNKEGGIFVFYDPQKDLDVTAHLELVHGSFEPKEMLRVTDLSFDFSFFENKAFVTNAKGRFASAFQEGGYFLNGKEIQLRLGEAAEILFDVRLENQVMDLIRCVGSYDVNQGAFQFDTSKTHFFNIFPSAFQLKLDPNLVPKEILVDLALPFQEGENFARFLTDIKIFDGEMGGLFSHLTEFEGALQSKICLKEGIWEIDLGSETFQMQAKKDRNKWELARLNIGSFSFSGDILKEAQIVSILNLKGLGDGSVFSFKTGLLDLEKKRITLPIHEAFVDFKECFPKLGEGKVSLNGVLELDFSKGFSNSFIEAKIHIEGEKDLFHVVSLSEIHLMYTLDQGLVIKDSTLEVKYDGAQATIEIPFGSYSFEEGLWQGHRIKTSYGDAEIEALLKKTGLQFEIPKKVSGKTEVIFDLEVASDQFRMNGFFGEGTYTWKGKEGYVKEVKWFYDKSHFDIDLVTALFGSEFDFHAKVYPDDLGLLIVEGFEKGNVGRALYAECCLFDTDGFSIQKIQGNLFGLDFQFLPTNKMEDWIFLGDVKIDMDKLLQVVGPDTKALLEDLKFHKGYELKGELTIQRDNPAASFFEGYLKGRDFDFLGYMFKTLLASVKIDQKGVSISDLSISDESVAVSIPELKIDVSGKGDLYMRIPELKIDELRPSLLQKKHAPKKIKPFCIKTMVFQDISGNLADERSFTGKGSLRFVNTFKEGHNLLDVPLEIISRLGLDIGLLVPVEGELDYVLKNGKMVFTKLKNSYSESKRSYFYLWNKTESYIDFSGNIHIDIRMKQYVLFKITELFILSIQGSLENPKCFLR